MPDSSSLQERSPRTEVPLSVTSSACTKSVTLSGVIWTLVSVLSYYNGLKRYKKLVKKLLLARKKCVTLIIPQKLEIIKTSKSCKSQREVRNSYNVGSSTLYETEGPIMIIYDIK
jgi:hypothetical protein